MRDRETPTVTRPSTVSVSATTVSPRHRLQPTASSSCSTTNRSATEHPLCRPTTWSGTSERTRLPPPSRMSTHRYPERCRDWRRSFCPFSTDFSGHGAVSRRSDLLSVAATTRRFRCSIRLLVCLWLFYVPPCAVALKGLAHTESGYDNPGGTDPVCWSANEFDNNTVYDDVSSGFRGAVFKSELIPDFVSGPVTMEARCPDGILDFHMDAPEEVRLGSQRLITEMNYQYHLKAEFDLTLLLQHYSLSHPDAFFSDANGDPYVAFSITFCDISGTFCTPFVAEEQGESDSHDDHQEADHSGHDHNHIRRYLAGSDHGHNHAHEHSEHSQEEEEASVHEHSSEDSDDEHEGHFHGDLVLRKDEDEVNAQYHGHDHDHGHGSAHEHGHESEGGGSSQTLHARYSSTQHAPTFLIRLNRSKTYWELDVDIPVTIDHPGIYLPLATMQFFLFNGTSASPFDDRNSEDGYRSSYTKVDIANVLHQRSIWYKDPAHIRKVSTLSRVISYVAISLAGAAMSYILYLLWYHRHNKVLLLSQGYFLVIFQTAAVVSSTSTLLFEPSSDLRCFLSGPLVLIPLQLMIAILIGRLRRIITLMSPLMNWGSASSGTGSAASSTHSCSSDARTDNQGERPLPKPTSSRRSGSRWSSRMTLAVKEQRKLRQEYGPWRLWRCVLVCMMPLTIVLVLHYALSPPYLTVEVNFPEETYGKYQCGSDTSQWFQFTELSVVYVMLFVLLAEAQRSKNLPALFNEAHSIAQASLGTVFIATVGMILIIFSNSPTANPDIRYTVMVFVTLSLIVNLSFRLVYPKFKVIWSGKNVLVSQLIRDHERSKHQLEAPEISIRAGDANALTDTDSAPAALRATTADVLPGADQANKTSRMSFEPSLASVHEERCSGDCAEGPSLSPTPEQARDDVAVDKANLQQRSAGRIVAGHKLLSWTGQVKDASAGPRALRHRDSTKNHEYSSDAVQSASTWRDAARRNSDVESVADETASSDATPLIVIPGQAPPSKLCMGINMHAQLLYRLNNRIMSGIELSKKDWQDLRSSIAEMDVVFEHQVQYSWQPGRRQQEQSMSTKQDGSPHPTSDPKNAKHRFDDCKSRTNHAGQVPPHVQMTGQRTVFDSSVSNLDSSVH